jgi:hypothetical protein
MVFIVLVIFLVYAYLGSKLKKNPLVWGFIGLGVSTSIPIVTSPLLVLVKQPSTGLTLWTAICLAGIIFSFVMAAFVAHKNRLIFKKNIG